MKLLHRELVKDYRELCRHLEGFKAHMRNNPDEEEVTIKPKDYAALMEFKKGTLEAMARQMRIQL